MGQSAVNYGNVRKSNDGTYNSNNTHYRRRPDNYCSRNSDCSRFNLNDVPELCWYHYKYGPIKARKCHGKPCPMFPCLNTSKKRVSWLAIITSRKLFLCSNSIFVKDSLSDMEFLIDSGSSVCKYYSLVLCG